MSSVSLESNSTNSTFLLEADAAKNSSLIDESWAQKLNEIDKIEMEKKAATELVTTTTTPLITIGHKELIKAHEHLVDKDYDKMKYRFYDPDSPSKQFGALIVVPIQFKVISTHSTQLNDFLFTDTGPKKKIRRRTNSTWTIFSKK